MDLKKKNFHEKNNFAGYLFKMNVIHFKNTIEKYPLKYKS